MYGVIDRCYGIELQNVEGICIDEKYTNFLRELIAYEVKDESPETIQEMGVDNLNDLELSELIDWILECEYCWSSYCGSGERPIVIGISLHSWAYWELEGPDGIISMAKFSDPTLNEVKAYEDKLPDYVKDLMKKHEIKPRVIWTTSTS